MANLDEALDGVDKEKADVIKEVFTSAIEAEKTKGIESRREANNEAKGLRSRLQGLEGVIIDSGLTIPEVEKDGKKVYDYDSFGLSLKELRESKKKVPEKETELGNMKNKLKEYESQIEGLKGFQSKYEEERQKAKTKALESKLIEGFTNSNGESDIYGRPDVIKNLINEKRVDLDEDGGVIWKDGENKLDFKTGKEKFLEDRKDLVRMSPKNGSGGSGEGGKPTSDRASTLEKVRRLRRGF